MAKHIPEAYRQPLMGRMDSLFKKCLTGSGILGAAVLLVVFLTPLREQAITEIDDMPERFAKLILEEPKKPDPPAAIKKAQIEAPPQPEPEPAPAPTPKVEPPKPPKRRRPDAAPKVQPDAGKVGRERAQKVTETLTKTTTELKSALNDLSASLATSTTTSDKPKKKRRRRNVRGGRSSSEMSTVSTGEVATGDGSALAGSAIGDGDLIAVESLSLVESGGGGTPGGKGEDGSVSGGGSALRSNASLLAVVRRYAAGIQYCYENELKRESSLAGKVVVAITIAAAGNVLNATVVDDSIGSEAMLGCAMAQIREWKFPKIDEGVVTFRAPFVFTPPKK